MASSEQDELKNIVILLRIIAGAILFCVPVLVDILAHIDEIAKGWRDDLSQQ